MKKLFILSILSLTLAVAAQAQEYKKFKVGVGLGYAKPGGDGASGGVLFYVEPAYRLSDAIQLGLRMESALVVRGFDGADDETDLDIATVGSYTVNGQYYFSNNGFRPFAGLGFGLYSLAAVELDTDDSGNFGALAASETKFGFYPRVGFDAGHFQLSIDYNLIPKTESNFTYSYEDIDGDIVTETQKLEIKNSYLGIRIGVAIGGGRK